MGKRVCPAFPEKTFFLLFRLFQRTADTLYVCNVDTADRSFDLFFYRDQRIDLGITHQRKNFRSDFSLYDKDLGTAHTLGNAFHDGGGEAGFTDRHFLFIDNEHGDRLCDSSHLLLLFCLLFFHFLSEKIENDYTDQQNADDDEKYYPKHVKTLLHLSIPVLHVLYCNILFLEVQAEKPVL